MSLVKFELKSGHVALMKSLCFDDRIGLINQISIEDKSPFGGDSLTEDLALILFGKPEGEFDPLSEESSLYSAEQITEMLMYFTELPTALEVVCNTASFELGHYKRKFHEKHWKKYTPKEK